MVGKLWYSGMTGHIRPSFWRDVRVFLTAPVLPLWVMALLLLGSVAVAGYAVYVSYLARLAVVMCTGV